MLVWAAPAYLKKEGATPHPGACKHRLQYDGRSDLRCGLGREIIVLCMEMEEIFVMSIERG